MKDMNGFKDIYIDSSIDDIDGLAELLEEVNFDPMKWEILYKSKVDDSFWKEVTKQGGHGEAWDVVKVIDKEELEMLREKYLNNQK